MMATPTIKSECIQDLEASLAPHAPIVGVAAESAPGEKFAGMEAGQGRLTPFDPPYSANRVVVSAPSRKEQRAQWGSTCRTVQFVKITHEVRMCIDDGFHR